MRAHITCPICGQGLDLELVGETAAGWGAIDDGGCAVITVSGQEYSDHLATHLADPRYAQALRDHAAALQSRADKLDAP